MLRLLFDSIEQSLGPSLSTIGYAVYWTGFLLLAMALIAPLYRRLMEFAANRLGLERHWVMPCRQCGRLTVVTVATCGFCDSDLKIPVALRLWTGLTRKRLTPGARTAQWAIQLAGNVLVLALCAWLMLAAGTLQPAGDVHRLFLGFALFGLGGVVWLGARAITPASRAAFARLRDGLIALAAVGMTQVSLRHPPEPCTQPDAERRPRATPAGWRARFDMDRMQSVCRSCHAKLDSARPNP